MYLGGTLPASSSLKGTSSAWEARPSGQAVRSYSESSCCWEWVRITGNKRIYHSIKLFSRVTHVWACPSMLTVISDTFLTVDII